MTKEQIKSLLLSNDRAVERAMSALYARQTADERSTSSTQHTNGRGFNAFDAKTGSYWARWVNSGRRLTGRHLEGARKMALKYVGQLADESASRLAGRVETVHVSDIGSAMALWDPFQHQG